MQNGIERVGGRSRIRANDGHKASRSRIEQLEGGEGELVDLHTDTTD